MTFNTKVFVSAVILTALAATFIIGSILSPENIQKRAENRPLFEGLAEKDIHGIEIAKGGQSVSLKRSGEQSWSVSIEEELFPADSSRIESFLSTLIKQMNAHFMMRLKM